MEDEIAHEDSIAIAAGNMCGMCKSVFHSSDECETKSSTKCSQCDSATINGVYSHEFGCPNRGNENG